ncbi:exodeoxyribonuclease VII large subunit [Sphingosinicella sp. LY1275]|uniref:exodeoxyribonuclease VII large subunit n=1 Tax=Sphingosinicella sp. LY1275 TaxID=3095379 RepID=UPI002ADECDA5|nr:exodeoxyribonuclease VII large subunit [Sphingosinicella sp. LY1275]MEA1015319.1 exodeoxyribonuclease VII large subunit [Sphingosinicella sp. LY1275]
MPDAARSDPDVGPRNTSVGLKAYLDSIAAVVKRVPSAWVRCELHALKVGDRFVRMEFIELDSHGKQIAKVQGGCWPDVWQRIDADFKNAGLPLEAGSQVMVKLDAVLNAAFGFQVNVSDIDLTFALGDLNARMQSIRKHLQDAGIWDRNRSLARPADFVRVSVIAPAGAAGLGDFRSTADRLADAGVAEFIYHEVPFQTRDAPARIVDVLRSIYRESNTANASCVVAIIRGGGASADLAWLVDQKLAEAVCRMNVPVMTGIGHERDRNLLDEIACIPCDTPSKVVEHISSTIVQAALEGRRAHEAIQSQAAQVLSTYETALTATSNAIDRDARETVRLAEATVRAAATGLEPDARRLLDSMVANVTSASEEARAAGRQRREAATQAIQGLRRNIAATVEAGLRPLDLGTERAISEIVTRLDVLPQSASDDIMRLHAQITDDAGRIASVANDEIAGLREQIIGSATRTMDDCSSKIVTIQDRADALHPRAVLASGYVILRDRTGSPLTSFKSARAADLITAEMRDGAIRLRNDETAHSEDKRK